MIHRTTTHRTRIAFAAALFAAGFFCGSISQRSAQAQLGDVGSKAMEAAGAQGGALGSAAKMGSAISDMQKNIEGLQKNLEIFKQIQAVLGG
ncbi:MAG: hypothetical protein U0807_08000 [Candidatus Binatia bacterium]